MLKNNSLGPLVRALLAKPAFRKVSGLIESGKSLEEIQGQLHDETMVANIFVDICSYNTMTQQIPEKMVHRARTHIFAFVSTLFAEYGIDFIKPIGDCAHFAGGLGNELSGRYSELADATLLAVAKLLDSIDQLNAELEELKLPSVKIKISASIGICQTGLNGTKDDFRYDIDGKWVNLVKRLEDSMDDEFYSKFGKNVALVAEGLLSQTENLSLRNRFFEMFKIVDKKNGTHYLAYVGRQIPLDLDEDEILKALHGQFGHKVKNPVKLIG